jgi:hypothetical protein
MGDRERNLFWGKAYAALVRIAMAWTHNAADSQDLAQSALTEAWAATPDEKDASALVKRAAWIMKGMLGNERKGRKRRGDERWLGGAVEASRGLRRTPEQEASTRERKERCFARAREELAGDAEALELVDEILKDHLTAAEQAEGLGWNYERVRRVRKRVDRVFEAIAEEQEEGPDSARGWDDDGRAGDAGDGQDEGDREAGS